MKAPDSFWKPARACSSLEVSMAGSAAGEAASFWMTAAARCPAGELSATVASRPRSLFSSTWPPADRTSAFTRTAYPSYRLPWTSTVFFALLAASIIWSQVKFGELGSTPIAATADLRYQSCWVLAQNGAATRLPFQVAVLTGAGRTPLVLSLIHISEPTRLLSISYAVFC